MGRCHFGASVAITEGAKLSSSARRGRSIPTPPRDTSTATHAATGRSPAGLIPTHPQRETQHARTQHDEHRAANTTPSQHHVRHVEPSPLAPRRASRVERRPGRRPRLRCDVVRLLRAARPVRPLDDAQIASHGALAHVHALGYLRVGRALNGDHWLTPHILSSGGGVFNWGIRQMDSAIRLRGARFHWGYVDCGGTTLNEHGHGPARRTAAQM